MVEAENENVAPQPLRRTIHKCRASAAALSAWRTAQKHISVWVETPVLPQLSHSEKTRENAPWIKIKSVFDIVTMNTILNVYQ